MPENQYAVNGNCTGLTPTSDCPFNFWRTSGDPEPGWGTIMRELNALRTVQNQGYGNDTRHHPWYNTDPPRSRPGGWAYPGTMVVGDGSMTKDENRVHFGVSDSPSFRLLRVTQTGQWLLCDLLHCIPAVRHASYSASEMLQAWCIVSSPLILAFNLSTPARHDLVWDIITNTEVRAAVHDGGGAREL
eukprot:COSAG01_NODE_1249_length_11069_cov_22.388332_9_plen_188_part_00